MHVCYYYVIYERSSNGMTLGGVRREWTMGKTRKSKINKGIQVAKPPFYYLTFLSYRDNKEFNEQPYYKRSSSYRPHVPGPPGPAAASPGLGPGVELPHTAGQLREVA